MSKVSVIIPTWNRAATLERAVRSALLQTYQNVEVLVCDDGSTDNSKEIVESIGDSRVRWIAGARGGRPAIPRNKGLGVCRGEWVAFLDDDDEWLPAKIEIQLLLAQNMGVRAVCSNAYRITPESSFNSVYLSENKSILSFYDLLKCNLAICSSVVFHHSLIDEVVGFPESEKFKVGEDYALWLRVSSITNFAYCPVPLLNYLDDPIHSIRGLHGCVWSQRKYVLCDFIKWLRHGRQTHTHHLRAARRQLLLAKWELMKKKLVG